MLLLVPACCQQKKRCIHFFHRLTKRGYLFVLKERTQNRSYRFVNKAAKPTVKCWIWNFCSAKYLVLLQSLRIYFYSEGGRREGKKKTPKNTNSSAFLKHRFSPASACCIWGRSSQQLRAAFSLCCMLSEGKQASVLKKAQQQPKTQPQQAAWLHLLILLLLFEGKIKVIKSKPATLFQTCNPIYFAHVHTWWKHT